MTHHAQDEHEMADDFAQGWAKLLHSNDIEKLFELWKTMLSMDASDNNRDFNLFCRAIIDLEARIMAAPTDSIRALHIKIAVADAHGDMRGNASQEELARQAWAALGEAGPTSPLTASVVAADAA